MRKTKIVATIGPASDRKEVFREILRYADGIRINCKHATYEEIEYRVNFARREKENVAVIFDIPGVEVRLCDVEREVRVEKGKEYLLVFDRNEKCRGNVIAIDNEDVAKSIREGHTVRIADGMLELAVKERIDGKTFKAVALSDYCITSKKAVSFPDTIFDFSVLDNEKNKELLKIASEMEIEYIAVSFVQHRNHIREVREFVEKKGYSPWIMPKIEHRAAISNLDEIVEEGDYILIARGDLAQEIGFEKLPVIQKMIIDRCIDSLKPVLVATQFLASMIENPVPTRAEVNDIANAVMDGCDALMLTNETANGKYPVEAVRMLHNVIVESERVARRKEPKESGKVEYIVARYARDIVERLENACMVVESYRGINAVIATRFKPQRKLYVLTVNDLTKRKLSLVYGIDSFIQNGELEEIKRKHNYTLLLTSPINGSLNAIKLFRNSKAQSSSISSSAF